MKREAFAGFALSTGLVLTGCTGPDSDKSYTLEGTVTAVDGDHIEINELNIIESHEAAHERLADGTDEIDDNYSDVNCWNHETSEDLDSALHVGEIAVGSRVLVVANLGKSYYNCIAPGRQSMTVGERAMLESLDVIE